jgi:NAD(P)-dependent dehydrogenase (short-subunit alcohol dehydrogenase family)
LNTQSLEQTSENVDVRTLFSLKGRIALITGGASRYGRQISQALAEAGATVIIASKSLPRRQQFVADLQAAGYDAHTMPLDLTDEGLIKRVAAEIREKWRKLDILFNNAAAGSAGSFERYPAEEWVRTLEVNALGLLRSCRTFGHLMAEQQTGSIVNIGSIYGVVSPDFNIYDGHAEMTNPPAYGFAKAGMIQLTRYLAVYFARQGVRVNCISPGGLYSPEMPAGFVANYCHRTPLGRMAGPNDLKGAAVFLASDASAYITGQNLLIDGGYTAL